MKFFFRLIINGFLGIIGYRIQNLNTGIPVYPVESTKEEQELINKYLKISMTNEIRMWSLLKSLDYVLSKNIDGDVVECGVWKGGCIGLMDEILRKNKSKKKVYAYDTFEGMSEPGIFDKDFEGNIITEKTIEGYEKMHGYPNESEVISNLEKSGCNLNNFIFTKGLVEKTLKIKSNLPSKISILRLDTDFYESTKIELEILYPLISKGGILIIDDYGHFEGARKAVDEFFREKKHLVHYVDYTCRLIQKN